jgi:hypothetical protein
LIYLQLWRCIWIFLFLLCHAIWVANVIVLFCVCCKAKCLFILLCALYLGYFLCLSFSDIQLLIIIAQVSFRTACFFYWGLFEDCCFCLIFFNLVVVLIVTLICYNLNSIFFRLRLLLYGFLSAHVGVGIDTAHSINEIANS